MIDELAEAIEQRHLVEFNYGGHTRVVIPAAVGNHATTGNEVLRGYQIRGTSSSRAVPLWDLFRLDRITHLATLDEGFQGTPPDYSRDDRDISPIRAQL